VAATQTEGVAAGRAASLFEASRPLSPSIHLVAAGTSRLVLIPNGSQVFEVDDDTFERLDSARLTYDGRAIELFLQNLGVDEPQLVDDIAPLDPPLRALSLAVAQRCNLGCTYCYAQQGSFGDVPKSMPLATALKAVDLLFAEANAGDRVNLAFLGGEPLINRRVIRAATEQAQRKAEETRTTVTFSITTNGTLVKEEDSDFFEQHGFAVTISLDGGQAEHDKLRPFAGGRGSYQHILGRVAPLLARQHRMQVSARVTVTPVNLDLAGTLDEFIKLGFHSVGFSPMLSSPTGKGELDHRHLALMLDQMVSCGEKFVDKFIAGERYPFTNMVNAMREIHRGTHRPYPCGAGAGYMGVSATGDLSACHRFVGDDSGEMGNIEEGIDRDRQRSWLTDRHVHRQEPCRSCWARYLCGGGCHHEVINRGRPACDYIRGWLHFCLGAYARLSAERPDYFGSTSTTPQTFVP